MDPGAFLARGVSKTTVRNAAKALWMAKSADGSISGGSAQRSPPADRNHRKGRNRLRTMRWQGWAHQRMQTHNQPLQTGQKATLGSQSPLAKGKISCSATRIQDRHLHASSTVPKMHGPVPQDHPRQLYETLQAHLTIEGARILVTPHPLTHPGLPQPMTRIASFRVWKTATSTTTTARTTRRMPTPASPNNQGSLFDNPIIVNHGFITNSNIMRSITQDLIPLSPE